MKKTNYGNWVPISMFYVLLPVDILLAVLCILVKMSICKVLIGVVFVLAAAMTIYMWICRRRFAFEHGGLMGEIHEFLLQHLSYDGQGTVLDIGCGAGALTIRCAKQYPEAELVGMDYWGKEWSYAKEQCEANADAEGVADRCRFEKGDAAKLSYVDESFDAAISNFVFHEVRTAADKRDVVREALRVIKPGGSFAFQDMFGQQKLYGDMNEFVEQLKAEGITEIHYIPDVDRMDFIPGFIRAPWMLYQMGLIYGKK